MAPVPVDLSRKTILTLDDDPSMRGVIRAALERHGCKSILATGSGQRALEMLNEHFVDVVICDMQMEPMDGLSFLAAARAERHNTNFKTIMLTAGSPETTKEALHALRIDAWLFKPISAARLIDAIGAVLGGRIEAVMPEADTDRVLAEIAERYHAKLASDVQVLLDLTNKLPGPDYRLSWRALRRLLHDMKGQAGTFGLDLVTVLAGMGDDLLRQAGEAAAYGTPPHAELNRAMQVIASAIAMVVQTNMRGSGGAAGEKLVAKLEAFLGPVRALVHVDAAQPAVKQRRGWS